MEFVNLTNRNIALSQERAFSANNAYTHALTQIPSRLLRHVFETALGQLANIPMDEATLHPGPMVDRNFLFACERLMALNADPAAVRNGMCVNVTSLYVLTPQHRASVFAPGVGTLTASFDAPLSTRYRTFPVSSTRSYFMRGYNPGAFSVAFNENRPVLVLKGNPRVLIDLLDRASLNQSRLPVAPFMHGDDLYVVSQLTATSHFHVAGLWKIVPRAEYPESPRTPGAVIVEAQRGLRLPGDRTGELLAFANSAYVLTSYATALVGVGSPQPTTKQSF